MILELWSQRLVHLEGGRSVAEQSGKYSMSKPWKWSKEKMVAFWKFFRIILHRYHLWGTSSSGVFVKNLLTSNTTTKYENIDFLRKNIIICTFIHRSNYNQSCGSCLRTNLLLDVFWHFELVKSGLGISTAK